MLNQIEKQFESFITAMYGNKTISEAQEKDIEKSFYAGMVVASQMITSLDHSEDIALSQLEKLLSQIHLKAEECIDV